MEDVSNAIRLSPDSAEGYGLRAEIFRDQAKLDLAVIDYTRAIQLDPKLGAAFQGRAIVYLARHEFEKAHADCQRAIELAPKDPVPHSLWRRFISTSATQNQAFANSIWQSASPKNAMACKDRAAAYWARGDSMRAIRDATTVLRLHPSVENYMSRGLMFQETKDSDSAIDDFSSVLRMQPDCIEAYVARGFCLQSRALQHQKLRSMYFRSVAFARVLVVIWNVPPGLCHGTTN